MIGCRRFAKELKRQTDGAVDAERLQLRLIHPGC